MRSVASISGAQCITDAIRAAKRTHGAALAPFLTAGYPSRGAFPDVLQRVAAEAELIEVGVPFSDPVADGETIQRSSFAALREGVSMPWILDVLGAAKLNVPVVLMSYSNPLLAYGIDRLVRDAATVSVSGFIVPDMPLEESAALQCTAESHGLCVIQMVSPVTSAARLQRLGAAARGFVYATTIRGTTGAHDAIDESVAHYLGTVRQATALPVLAGFGIRSARDVSRLQPHCDGVVVGSALIETIDRGEDPAAFLRQLRVNDAPTPIGGQP